MMPKLPSLVCFMIIHATLGFVLAGVFTLALVMADVGGIGTLLDQADGYPWPTVLLWFLLGLTTSSCQMGAAVMLLGDSGDGGGTKHRSEPLIALFRLASSKPLPRPAASQG